MKHTALSFAILFSMAGMTATQAETPAAPQLPAIMVAPATPDVPAITVAPAVTDIPAVPVATEKAEIPVVTVTPVETGVPATEPVTTEASVEEDVATTIDASVAAASTPDTGASAGAEDIVAKPAKKRKCKTGKGRDGKKHGKCCKKEHRRQMEERLDLIDARLAKIEAMLERLMRR